MAWYVWPLLFLTSPSLPVVMIDPGHGGECLGAVGPCGAIEKDVTLAVSQELARVLRATRRVSPVLTRATDQTLALEDRCRMANQAEAALFLSVHANAARTEASNGVETFFLSRRAASRRIAALAHAENEGAMLVPPQKDETLSLIIDSLLLNTAHAGSQRFAVRIQDAVVRSIPARDRGVFQAPFIVLFGTQMPAALVEIGFITNDQECRLLADVAHQREIAQALASAILDHLAIESAAWAENSNPGP